MRQVECGRMGNQQGSCADGLRLRTPPSTAREPCALRSSSRLGLGRFVWITGRTRGRCLRCGVRPGRWWRSFRSGWRCRAIA
ncbi:hypothetical protein F3K43_18410 [Streptomyces sp. LBUM 1476]|nr:hypothetical protein [Streptomyces sp. LBUM 1476]